MLRAMTPEEVELVNEATLLVAPVLMSSLKAFFVPELWSMHATRVEVGSSVIITQKSASTVLAIIDRVKTVPEIVSCHDLKALVVPDLDTPRINESLRTAACALVWPVLADARSPRSGVKTSALMPAVSVIVHG